MPQTEDNPTPPFPAYRVTVDGVGLYITGHEGGYNVVYPDGRYETITAEYPDRAHAAADLTGKVHAIPVPQEVTRPRFIIALRHILGLATDDVIALIVQIEDPVERADIHDWFVHGVFFNRQDPRLVGFAAANGVTSGQLDAVFIHAGTQT